ncbi:hypothetical protein ACPV5S_15685 [Vibrio astriarenae]|jgi:hypothetical protein
MSRGRGPADYLLAALDRYDKNKLDKHHMSMDKQRMALAQEGQEHNISMGKAGSRRADVQTEINRRIANRAIQSETTVENFNLEKAKKEGIEYQIDDTEYISTDPFASGGIGANYDPRELGQEHMEHIAQSRRSRFEQGIRRGIGSWFNRRPTQVGDPTRNRGIGG